MNKTQTILIAVVAGIVVLLLGFILGIIGGNSNPIETVDVSEGSGLTGDAVYNPANYEKQYPLEYASYMYAKEETPDGADKEGNFGGNDLFDHKLKQDQITTNFKGNAFSKDYKDDRGHVWAVADIYATERVNETTKGACITCKTPYLEALYAKYPGNNGWDYAKQSFADIKAMVPEDHGSISCATCHDPETMDLRVINKALIEAMDKLGIDLTKGVDEENGVTQQDMRSYVCAQCHVEYYFEPETVKVVFPWEQGAQYTETEDGWVAGLQYDQAYQYYVNMYGVSGKFQFDFKQTDSEAPILKAQHPDFETWRDGIHGRAGVSCADCHMPYVKENDTKYAMHDVTSPLRTVEESCMTCHKPDSGQTVEEKKEWLITSVTGIQDKFWVQQHEAEKAVAELHNTIKAAKDSGITGKPIEDAQMAARQAQWYWDFVAAENSMGFHNPVQGMKATGESIVIANNAIKALLKEM